jgi:hypothetical protein
MTRRKNRNKQKQRIRRGGKMRVAMDQVLLGYEGEELKSSGEEGKGVSLIGVCIAALNNHKPSLMQGELIAKILRSEKDEDGRIELDSGEISRIGEAIEGITEKIGWTSVIPWSAKEALEGRVDGRDIRRGKDQEI